MLHHGFSQSVIIGTLLAGLCAGAARATDLRFDVVTFNGSAQAQALMPDLNFPSGNGHVLNMGSDNYLPQISSSGNSLGIYYNTLTQTYTSGVSAHDSAETIENWVNRQFGSANRGGWVVLNEVSSSIWSSSDGDNYRAWLVNLVQILKNGDNTDPANPIPAHQGVILYAPFANPGSSNRATWQAISQYAYIGDECYVNGQTVNSLNYSVSAVQSIYQNSYNSWTLNAGVPGSRVILGEEFTNSLLGNGYGANGLSGSAWQAAIEARNLAAYNVGFGGFIGYAWGKNAQNSDYATLQSYENAYASARAVQGEIACWDGLAGDGSWSNYLNWTGGLPSTIQSPYPLLANTNPDLPNQTAANFLGNAIDAPSTVTLDGNQSINTVLFDSTNTYTIAPGTGGSLIMSGPGASIAVEQGSHIISTNVILNSDVAVNIKDALTISGALSTQGHAISKTGSGTLTLSGQQFNSRGSSMMVTAGTLNLNSDAGSAASRTLNLSMTAGNVNFNSTQHLNALSISNARASIAAAGRALVASSINVTGAGTLDLGANELLVDYTGASPISIIGSEIASGYNNGQWNGPGIDSSAAGISDLTALGYGEASDVLNLLNGSDTFDGEPIDSTTLLVKYTWVGDANLDGVVNSADLSRMTIGGTIWSQGDFNFDGVVNADDYALFALGYGRSESANISTIVPEPSSAAMLLMLVVPSLFRRRGA